MNQYQWLEAYLSAKPGAVKDYKLEWGWQRWQVGGKMFAAVCQPEGYAAYENRELVSLKCEPLLAEGLRLEYPDILPGFYMDKRNWNSIYLDGAVPEELLRELCDRSWTLVFAKLTKKAQREILDGASAV